MFHLHRGESLKSRMEIDFGCMFIGGLSLYNCIYQICATLLRIDMMIKIIQKRT
jgi:hypothetical protein